MRMEHRCNGSTMNLRPWPNRWFDVHTKFVPFPNEMNLIGIARYVKLVYLVISILAGIEFRNHFVTEWLIGKGFFSQAEHSQAIRIR